MKTGVEMLACPMCGGRADTGGHTGTIYVECQVCGVLGSCAIDEDGAIAAWNTRQTHPAATGSVREAGGQDRKFAFRDGQFVNRVSGEPIPHDEPVIIFRARDHHAIPVLREYLSMATDDHHRQAIRERLAEFAAYRDQHPERMKEPGITHHIALAAAPTPDAAASEVIHSPAPMAGLPADVRRLVIAARGRCYGDDTLGHDLDAAVEAFATRVPWDDEPVAHPSTHEGADRG